ncbi:hypothetical protein L1887_62052 [Cichorium endivia]|nr:hypothetical protein L1887_62052 [Cichorium endivia]
MKSTSCPSTSHLRFGVVSSFRCDIGKQRRPTERVIPRLPRDRGGRNETVSRMRESCPEESDHRLEGGTGRRWRLCRRRGLLDSGREHVAALLLEQHNVEAVKVRQRAAGLDGSALLGPAGLRPLLGNTSLVKELLDGRRAGTTGKTGHGELGQGEVLEGEGLAANAGGGRVNDGLSKVARVPTCHPSTPETAGFAGCFAGDILTAGFSSFGALTTPTFQLPPLPSSLPRCFKTADVFPSSSDADDVAWTMTRCRMRDGSTYPVVVDDLDDDGELAGGRALLNEDNTANLDVTLEGSRHCGAGASASIASAIRAAVVVGAKSAHVPMNRLFGKCRRCRVEVQAAECPSSTNQGWLLWQLRTAAGSTLNADMDAVDVGAVPTMVCCLNAGRCWQLNLLTGGAANRYDQAGRSLSVDWRSWLGLARGTRLRPRWPSIPSGCNTHSNRCLSAQPQPASSIRSRRRFCRQPGAPRREKFKLGFWLKSDLDGCARDFCHSFTINPSSSALF